MYDSYKLLKQSVFDPLYIIVNLNVNANDNKDLQQQMTNPLR